MPRFLPRTKESCGLLSTDSSYPQRRNSKHGDAETQRRRDAETQRRRDAETQRRRDAETRRRRDAETQRHRTPHTQTRRHADTQTHRHTDTETHRHRDTVSWRMLLGDLWVCFLCKYPFQVGENRASHEYCQSICLAHGSPDSERRPVLQFSLAGESVDLNLPEASKTGPTVSPFSNRSHPPKSQITGKQPQVRTLTFQETVENVDPEAGRRWTTKSASSCQDAVRSA